MTTPAPVAYLRSLDAVRDRSKQVFDLVVQGKADHWDWHEEKLDDVVNYCLKIIQVNNEPQQIITMAKASATSELTMTRYVSRESAFLRPLPLIFPPLLPRLLFPPPSTTASNTLYIQADPPDTS
jgi:hypothetical protein